jgi:hypothetical protein
LAIWRNFNFLVMVVILDTGRCWRTQFWKGTIQGSFQQMILGWSPFKIVSVSAVLYPRWPPWLKIEISANGQDCSILSQKVPKIWTVMEGGAVGHNFEREPPRGHPCQVWFNLVQQFQRRRFFFLLLWTLTFNMNQYRLSLDVSGLSGKILIIKNRNQQTSNLDNKGNLR